MNISRAGSQPSATGPIEPIRPGDFVWIEPGEKHFTDEQYGEA